MLPQADSLYRFDASAPDSAVFQRPHTPRQAIRLLPPSASEAEKDAIVQKYFKPVIVAPSSRPDTLYLPGLPSVGSRVDHLPTYQNSGFFRHNALLHPELRIQFMGIPGDPVPYTLRDDLFITSILLLSFFVAMYIIARSWHVLRNQLKNFFYNRDRKQIFTLKSDTEVKNQFFVILLACFQLTILAFNYAQLRIPTLSQQFSPYILLALYMVVFLLYYIGKYIVYGWCNWTFFSSSQRSQWANAYGLIAVCRAFLLFPLLLTVVYFDLSLQLTLLLFAIILVVVQIMVIFKAKQIFFSYKFGLLHLFLYFCTLEFAPMLFALLGLLSVNQYLILSI